MREQEDPERWGFIHWKLFDREAWQSVVQDAQEKQRSGLLNVPVICGSDNSEQLVGIARENIRAAGLASLIKVSLQDATQDLKPCTEEHGLLVTNPPYGKRIGQVQVLRTLYHRFGEQLKAGFDGWTAVIITSEPELARSIGLRAFRKNTLYNGALKSVLYQYRINALSGPSFEKPGDVGGSADSVDIEPGAAVLLGKSEHSLMFANRLKKNYKHLKKWARKNDVTCYRVYDADIPQYAVAIDIYEQWVYVQEYKAPKTVDKNKAFLRINDVIDVVADILETKQEYVVLKVRQETGRKLAI